MKIIFFLGSPNPFPGAAWARIGFFAKDWSNKGHAIEVLGAFSYKSFYKKGVIKMSNITIFNLVFRIGSTHPLFFILNAITSFICSAFFLFSRKRDIAIVSVPVGDVGLGALMACKIARTRCIVDYRDEWEDYTISLTNSKVGKFFYSAVKKFMTAIYAKSQLITAVTPNFVSSLKRRGVVKVRLVPNGADATVFKPLTSKTKTNIFTIFYSGGIGGYYRLDVAVKALKRLVDNGLRNIKLVITGEGEVQKILHLAIELGIPDKIDYNGSVSDRTELARLINESDVGLIPYDDNPLWKNSIPAKFFEYCACGIPVIITAYSDSLLAAFVRKNEVGVTSPPMDEEKLAEAIYQIYENKSFREAAGKRARLLIEDKFDRNKIAEKFLNLVMECA